MIQWGCRAVESGAGRGLKAALAPRREKTRLPDFSIVHQRTVNRGDGRTKSCYFTSGASKSANHTYKRMEKPCSMDPHPRHEDKDLDHEEEGVVHSVSASVIAKTDQVRVMENM